MKPENDMKCICSKKTQRCTLKALTRSKHLGKFGRVAFINRILEYELREGYSSNFT